jgi:NAD(P)-dependent dehydrogenase (short-subunit alcohol dehydrogenase family)
MTKAGGVEVEQSNISLEGKVCLITGGARGIGAAVARAVAAQGALVAINFLHSQKEAMKLVEELQQKGHKALALQADISREEEVSRLFGELRKAWGEVELLVNNAGVALRTLVQETTVSEWDRVMNVNLKGAFLCCREALPHMIRKRYGRIVNIASIQGISGASYDAGCSRIWTGYCTCHYAGPVPGYDSPGYGHPGRGGYCSGNSTRIRRLFQYSQPTPNCPQAYSRSRQIKRVLKFYKVVWESG